MLALDRQRKILELLQSQGSVRTTDLAATLEVTEETIRRDFDQLDRAKLLVRSHGGAVRFDSTRRDLPLSSRENLETAAKAKIALLTLAQIVPGETVFLDASSTVFELAKSIPNLSLTVITCGIKVAIELASRPLIKVVLLGGTVNPGSLSTEGNTSLRDLTNFRIHKALLSCRGVDPVRGPSEANEFQAEIKRQITSLAEEIYLLADHTKLGLKSTFYFCSLARIHALNTDQKPAADFLAAQNIATLKIQYPTPD